MTHIEIYPNSMSSSAALVLKSYDGMVPPTSGVSLGAWTQRLQDEARLSSTAQRRLAACRLRWRIEGGSKCGALGEASLA